MFKKLFKKENPEISIFAPVSGKLISLKNVKDDVFSKELIGKGIAIIPSVGDIYAPVNGKVVGLFPTKHAIQFESDDLKILVHLGIDTVSLKGKPFKWFIDNKEKVYANEKIGEMDLNYLKKHNVDSSTMIIFPELNSDRKIERVSFDEKINAGDCIIKVR